MSEIELKLLREAANCTLYTIQFDEVIRQGEAEGSIVVSENVIDTNQNFEI